MKKLNITTINNIKNNKWITITFFVLLLALIMLNIKVIISPYLMMEDGFVFINGILRDGLKSLTFSYGGYMCLGSRLIALFAVFSGVIFNSVIVETLVNKFISVIVIVFIINMINDDKFSFISKKRIVRLAYSVILLLLSSNFLAILYTNLSMNWWSGLYLVLWVLLLLNGESPKKLDYIFISIAILSTPFSFIILIPLIINMINLKSLKIKVLKKENIKYVIFLIFIIIQFISIINSKDVDSASNSSISFVQFVESIKYTFCMCFSSLNYIFTPFFYKKVNTNLYIGILSGIVIFTILCCIAIKNKKIVSLISLCAISFIIYFLTIFKYSNQLNVYYVYLIKEQPVIWYHFIPAINAFLMVFLIIQPNFKNNLINIFLVIIFINIIIILKMNYYKPDLDYIQYLYDVEEYVDYQSNYYACIKVPPKWVDWCVLVPIEKNKCEEGLYECSEKI